MAVKKLILTKKQIDEICGDDFSYLDGLATKPDMGSVFANQVSSDGGTDVGYAKPTTTDDIASDITNDWRGNAKLHGMGPITVREMTKKEWAEMYLGEESEHGNNRLKGRRFGAEEGDNGKSYGATKTALCRQRKAQEKLESGSGSEKIQAAKTLSRMKKNWNGIDAAAVQYEAAKDADAAVQHNRPEGLKRASSKNGLPKINGGVFTS